MELLEKTQRKYRVQAFLIKEEAFSLLDINTSLKNEGEKTISDMEFEVAMAALSKISEMTKLDIVHLRKCSKKDYVTQRKGRYLFTRILQETTTIETMTIGGFLDVSGVLVYSLRNDLNLKERYENAYNQLFHHVKGVVLEKEDAFYVQRNMSLTSFANERVFRKFKEG